MIMALRNTLDFVREQEAAEREDQILLHRPRHIEPLVDPDEEPGPRRAQSAS